MAKERTVQVPGIDGGVVVGHDGSASSDRALVFGAEEARLRGLPLHVLRAWSLTATSRPKDVPYGVIATEDQYVRSVTEELEAAVERLLGAEPDVEVHVHAVHAQSSRALVAASAHADLLVVASRGLGGFTGLLVGSTSEQVVRHADCPVVVLRG